MTTGIKSLETNLTKLFRRYKENYDVIDEPVKMIETSEFPIRDSSTLNQILYKNEKQNKRDMPNNPENKPLHAIVANGFITPEQMNAKIDEDILNTDKAWPQLSIVLKRELMEEFCKRQNIEYSEEMKCRLLKSKRVKYNRKAASIESIDI